MGRPRSSNLISIALVLLLFGALRVDALASDLVGHVYMQTNETQNRIMHFGRNEDGQLELRESIPTGGAGSGVFKPISGQESAPNAFEGAGSVILAESNTLLFTTNGGDNSVTSFRVGPDGKLTVIDRQSTGEPVTGRTGTAKSLAYRPQSRTLYVLHAFGPNHLRSYTVAEDGKLNLRPERHSVNTATKTDRVSSQAVLSPDGRFLLVDILFDARPAANPDGSPNLVVANAPDPDGLVIFPVRDDGALDEALFADAGGAGPFYMVFINQSRDTFLNGVAAGDGVLVSRIDGKGRVTNGPLAPIDTSLGKPSELCWLQVTSDNSLVLATNFGYGTVSTYRLVAGGLSLLQDPANNAIPGDGTFRAVNGLVSSGPSDSWLTPDDQYFYQIFGNASVLVSYRLDKTSGRLTEIGRNPIPYNSPQGLAGF
ncbi:lactonase family protein [Bradyrhizobium cenepequi]|uniref:lactonase family protein n=1 Tax=Bradyrhizobium cenepequi TaxID=2821403 RepID=UPI001CE2F027|nr:lactonase family protein [Bradyrhizobium cenepequi]